MRLSWNEVRARAARFADEWQNAAYEKGETQSFYNAFFEIFGVRRRTVARYEEHVRKLDNQSGFIDLFWPGVLIVEQKSAGRDLTRAYGQAGEYFDALPERNRPRYILVSDFQSFELHDLDEGEQASFALAELPDHIEAFGFILGVQRRIFRDQDPVNVEASASMGRLHDALEASGYSGHDLEVFLVRTVFCLFADDTGIFEPRDLFLDLLETRTREDGSDLGPCLARLFQVLNTPVDQRQAKLDEDLARFPYVNGDLFAARLTIPDFDAAMRAALLDACRFDWAAISPAIFGALFQSVMNAAERRAQGAHYTTEKNILKVIGPLFLDDLRAEFNRLRARKDKLSREGDCLAAKLRPGNVHSAEDWEELLLPEIERQQKLGKEVVFRADAAFAKPEIYDALEERDVKYAIRIPANDSLERDIAELLTRPVGRPSHKPVVWYKSFLYQAASWKKARRVVAKVEFHFGELFPRVGFIVTNLETDSRAVVRFYNKRGTAEQWIKEGKQAVKMTRLSCHRFRSNEVRLWLSLIAYNLGNLWRRLVLPKRINNWSLTSLQQRLVKTGGRLVKHARYYWLLLAEGHLSRRLFSSMLRTISALPLPDG